MSVVGCFKTASAVGLAMWVSAELYAVDFEDVLLFNTAPSKQGLAPKWRPITRKQQDLKPIKCREYARDVVCG